MEINLLEQNGEKIVAIKGRVDTITASDLETTVSEIWSIPSTTLVFDCSEMDYISSSGLRVVIKAHKQVAAAGGKFIMRNLNREVRTVIDLTGFSRILVIE